MKRGIFFLFFFLIWFQTVSSRALAAPNYEQIKNNVEHSVEIRKNYRENGGEPGQENFQKVLEQQNYEALTNEQRQRTLKPEIKIIWSACGGRIKYWQINGQYYLHLG